MKSHSLSTIVYAQGFIGDFIEEVTEPLAVDEETMTDEQMVTASNENEHRTEARTMWRILSEGLTELRRENTALENKLALIDLARNTET